MDDNKNMLTMQSLLLHVRHLISLSIHCQVTVEINVGCKLAKESVSDFLCGKIGEIPNQIFTCPRTTQQAITNSYCYSRDAIKEII